MGWAHRIRDHGGVTFMDLRDRYGMTQVILSQTKSDEPSAASKLDTTHIGAEYVVAIQGEVQERPEGMKNPNLSTGEIEVAASDIEVLNASKTPPFVIEENVKATEDTRLRYRFLDLRRPGMKENIITRHKVIQGIRTYLDQNGFLEIETPILTRSTPEGARDFLVPSRSYTGKFFCLHTQIDIEMSFVDEEDVFRLAERMFEKLFKEIKGVELQIPFPRLTYEETMDRFGTDKPDLRYGMEIVDVTDIGKETEFKIFRETTGKIRMIQVEGGGVFTRKEIETLESLAQESGAKGLLWMK
jgi:aspartyl-tRNA synthetase